MSPREKALFEILQGWTVNDLGPSLLELHLETGDGLVALLKNTVVTWLTESKMKLSENPVAAKNAVLVLFKVARVDSNPAFQQALKGFTLHPVGNVAELASAMLHLLGDPSEG